MTGKQAKKAQKKYDDYLVQLSEDYKNHVFSQLGGLGDRQDSDAMDLINNQMALYRGYVDKEPNKDGADLISDALDDLAKRIPEDSVENLVQELTEIFNMLKEKKFKMGNAQYPGPGESWKHLVRRILPDPVRGPNLFY
jgi:hypothetical protein